MQSGMQTFHVKATNELERQCWVSVIELSRMESERKEEHVDMDEWADLSVECTGTAGEESMDIDSDDAETEQKERWPTATFKDAHNLRVMVSQTSSISAI